MATVKIDNVYKNYGKVQTLSGVTIEVPEGAFVVLVGPSGCGKSTLLRMIAGLEEISAGHISINGEVINEVEPKNRDIAMVFQNYALYPHMSVAQNMGFSLRLAKAGKQEIERRVTEAAEILGLSEYLNRYPKQLSGGQRQRVAMGRAIVRNPQVFLFDEPLSNLDAKLRVQMRAELKSLHQRLKTTTLYVTHDQMEAMTMADHIVVMRDGLVEQVGPPLDLFDYPSNRFVASFIGSPAMNFIEGKVERNHDRFEFVTQSANRLPLENDLGLVHEGKQCVYGIRPEHFFLVQEGRGLAAQISVLEPTGTETHVIAHAGNDNIVALLRERININPGSHLSLGINAENAHLFDADSGLRLEAVG